MVRSTLVAGLLAASSLGAQVVRGRVSEVASALPVPGAVVSLLGDTGDSAVVSVLTAESGDYAVRAPQAGRYRLAVKRIGVKRFVSAGFDLGSGETRVIDVPIDAIALTLPQVTVSGLCASRSRELSRIASLWEEARTALEATEISLRDRLIDARISRYAAEVRPGDLHVSFDWRSDGQVMTEQPFTSMSGDSLSDIGYWRLLPGDSVEYLAPDARALASNAFLRDHCFSLTNPPRNRRDLTGIAFVPSRDRRRPDIAGVIWLDARQFELRFIEFRYTKLPVVPNGEQAGGEVHFSRLGSGAWIVDRWFIRMPQVIVSGDDWPRRQLREEGGAVTAEGMIPATRFGSIAGVYRDSSGRPEADVTIRAVGTPRQTVTDSDGSYRLDSLPPGDVSLVARALGYDALGVLAASRRVSIQSGRVGRVDFRAPNAAALRREVCPRATTAFGPQRPVRGVLRMLLVDSATAIPLSGVRFLVSWPAALEQPGADSTRELYRQAVTDARGAATFCDLPPGLLLEVSVLGSGDSRSHVMMIGVTRNGIVGSVVSGRMNR